MAVEVVQANAPLGATVGVDLSMPMDDATFRDVEAAFHDNIVVVFRNQNLTNDQQIAFSRRFGELEIHVVKKYLLPDHPEILIVSNIRDENGEHIGLADAGFTWHSDTSYRRTPSRCSLLYAKEVPVENGRALGNTIFCNTIEAYNVLPESLKRWLDGKRAIHRYSERMRIDNSPRPKLTPQQLAETPDQLHPIVRTHAHTGRKALYVTKGECIGIEGVPEDEGKAVIEELHEHCIKPEFQYAHRWQQGDLLMWDNATCMHLAVCDYALPQRRLMYRTTVIGDEPA
jgi:taurine dioxygenase